MKIGTKDGMGFAAASFRKTTETIKQHNKQNAIWEKGRFGVCADDIAWTLLTIQELPELFRTFTEELAGPKISINKCSIVPLDTPNIMCSVELVRNLFIVII